MNGTNQQGLVRFAKRAISPTVDPIQSFSELAPTVTPLGSGTVRIGWKAAWDRDNERLTYEVLRGPSTATATVRTSFQTSSNWWNRPPLGFVDTTAPPGSSQTYRIRVTDPFGNALVGPAVTATVPAGAPPAASTYAAAVQADKPAWQWRLGETSGTTAYDRAGSNDEILERGEHPQHLRRVGQRGRHRYRLPGFVGLGAGARRVALLAAGSADVLARGVGEDDHDDRRQDHRFR